MTKHPYQDLPWVLIGEQHRNFCNLRLYEIEVMFRDWLEKSQQRPDWKARTWNKGYRVTIRHVATQLGLDPKWGGDQKLLCDLLMYYAITRTTNPSTTEGMGVRPDGFPKTRRLAKSGYHLPFKNIPPPYSLKLRYDLALQGGQVLLLSEMEVGRLLGKRESKKHETQKAMEKRSKQAQDNWQKNYGGKYKGRWDHDGFPRANKDTDAKGGAEDS